jgi:hypothetical protein
LSIVNDELVIRLFQRHFDDPVATLRRLDAHLASVDLPFDLKAQLRELIYPPQPGLPDGLPSFIYYFVPDSHRGSAQSNPETPLHPAFLRTTDGIGLNLGCPVRLLRAMDALGQLPVEEQQPSRDALRNLGQHLSAVEELLWLTVWKSPCEIRRGGQFVGMHGDVDWALKANGFPIFLEAKFRQSDWPRLSERDSFSQIGGGFLSNAAHKFPDPPQVPAIHILGITTFDNIDGEIGHRIGHELETLPQIHAVVVRTLMQMTHVLSLSSEICNRVTNLLSVPSITDFPYTGSILFHREQRDRRVAMRSRTNAIVAESRVVWDSIQPRGPLPCLPPEPDLYRLNIPSHSAEGEPQLQIIPKYLMEPNES